VEEIKAKWASLGFWGKLLFILGIPLFLVMLLLKGIGSMTSIFEKKKREEVDQKSKEFDEAKAKTDQEIARSEGRLEEIQKQKEKAVKDASEQDPVDFHNRRKPS
jgi:predicted Holliday junction resolvase-like endonuclease